MLHKFFPAPLDHKGQSLQDLSHSEQVSGEVSAQVSGKVSIEKMILEYCTVERSFTDILKQFGYKNRGYFKEKYMNPLINKGFISLTNPNSPNSPTQKYYTVVHNDAL